jgi:hypothetical protein
MLKKIIFILILTVATVLPRLIFLDKVPNSVNRDEIQYLFNAKSLFLTGKDVSGEVSPVDILLFHHPKNIIMQAELSYILNIPMSLQMKFSLVNIALPYALLSILTVMLIYLIGLKLFDKRAAFTAGAIAAINPWLIFLGRTLYDMGPATLFFLCVFYILLITKGWKILLTIPFALLAFYSYIGTKLIFLPFMFLSIAYAYLYINKRRYLKQYSLLFAFSCILTLFFLLQIGHGTSRISEVIMPNSIAITQQVNEARKTTLQNPLKDIFENKILTYLTLLTKNTVNVFSPSYLFVNADYFFLNGEHGLFYYIDAIFLVVGLIWLLENRKKLFIFLMSFIFIAALPQILHDPYGNGNFTPHITLLIPFVVIAIAIGIDKSANVFKNKKYSYLFIAVTGIIYLFSFLNFANLYYFRFPLQQGTFDIQNRILSRYISLADDNKRPIIVYSVNPEFTFREFLYYSDNYNRKTAKTVNKSLAEGKFSFNNISFVSCDKAKIEPLKMAVVIDDTSCKRQWEQV